MLLLLFHLPRIFTLNVTLVKNMLKVQKSLHFTHVKSRRSRADFFSICFFVLLAFFVFDFSYSIVMIFKESADILHETMSRREIEYARVPHTVYCHHYRQHNATKKRIEWDSRWQCCRCSWGWIAIVIEVHSRTGCFTLYLSRVRFSLNSMHSVRLHYVSFIYNSIKCILLLKNHKYIHFCTVRSFLFLSPRLAFSSHLFITTFNAQRNPHFILLG